MSYESVFFATVSLRVGGVHGNALGFSSAPPNQQRAVGSNGSMTR